MTMTGYAGQQPKDLTYRLQTEAAVLITETFKVNSPCM